MCYRSERNNKTLMRKRDKLENAGVIEGNENEGCNLLFMISCSDVGSCYMKMVAGSTDTRQTFT